MIDPSDSIAFIEAQLLERNRLAAPFFAREAQPLARACRSMADRFAQGGRLLAIGRAQYATDAQHVEVEFVHPVIVGKRALPALDLSQSYRESVRALLRPEDMVMVFGPPEGDPELRPLLAWARAQGAQTFALPGEGEYGIEPWSIDPFVHQEIIEILYHTLWETVHVFFDHRELGQDAGQAGFLYPFLGHDKQDTEKIIAEVAASICAKAEEDARLRSAVAREQGDAIARAVVAIHQRVARGGSLILFGNGGSATDANDWALDCIAPPKGHRLIPAISLSTAAASLSAVANDIGAEALFLRPLIAHARPGDVAIGISTSGGSGNVIAALEEARRRGLLTVALLGYDGGEVLRRGLVDHAIVVNCDYIPRIQEVHASVYHVMLDLLDALQRGSITADEVRS